MHQSNRLDKQYITCIVHEVLMMQYESLCSKSLWITLGDRSLGYAVIDHFSDRTSLISSAFIGLLPEASRTLKVASFKGVSGRR